MTGIDLLKGAGSAIFDQGLVSGANFLFTVLLARWIGSTEYGIFAVVNSILVFFTGAHSALLLEPMSVLGPARFSDDLRRYLKVMTRINWAMALPASGLLTVAGFACLLVQHLRPFGMTLLALAFSLPCLLFFQVYRRLCYVDHRPQRALAGSLIYATLLVAGAIVIGVTHEASPAAAFTLIGACGMVAGLILFSRLLATHHRKTNEQHPEGRGIWRDHWNYGRWILLASLTYWGSTEVYYSLTAWHVGLQEAATLRALQNLIAPIMQLMSALGTMLLPFMSAVYAESGQGATMTAARRITLFMTLGAAAYGIALLGAGDAVMRIVYLGRYSSYHYLLPYVAGLPLVVALASGSQLSLRAMQRPWTVLIGYATSAALTGSLGLAMVWRWGLKGAALGLALSLGVYAIVSYGLARSVARSSGANQ